MFSLISSSVMLFSKFSVTWIRFIYLLSFCHFHSKLITILMALLIVIFFNTLIINRIYLSLINIFLIVCCYFFWHILHFFFRPNFATLPFFSWFVYWPLIIPNHGGAGVSGGLAAQLEESEERCKRWTQRSASSGQLEL